jgi:acetylglutamate kinase
MRVHAPDEAGRWNDCQGSLQLIVYAFEHEALPWLERFHGALVVIKYGGHAMTDPELTAAFAEDIVFLRYAGLRPVVVHGGGPQISDLMQRLGKQPEFVDGLRVTDAETVDIVRMALVGKVNREVVGALNQHGSLAVGLSGEDAGLIRVKMRDERLGFVGDVTNIDASILERLIREELIPVVATVGVDDTGQAYNVNADTVAGAIAEAVAAEKLVYLTDVAGVYGDYGDESSLISRIDADGLAQLLAGGKVGYTIDTVLPYLGAQYEYNFNVDQEDDDFLYLLIGFDMTVGPQFSMDLSGQAEVIDPDTTAYALLGRGT